jgi:NADH-quinone oxidoreductase subunit L
MFVALGVGGYSIGMFHLFTHAFFKALLFLGAGTVIDAMHHEQDMRRMGGLWRKIPFTFAMMVIGTLALTGFPYTSGFYSKDEIVEAAFAAHTPVAFYGFLMTVAAAALTSFYSWRLVFLTFFGAPRWAEEHRQASDRAHGAHEDEHHGGHRLDPHEAPLVMLIPLAVLSIGALFAGALFDHDFVGEAADRFWKNALYYAPGNHLLAAMEHVPPAVQLAPTLMIAGGFLVALYIYILAPGTAARLAGAMPALYRFLLNKWYFDELYDRIFVRPAFWLGRLFWKGGDGAVIDRWGPDGVAARVVDITGRVVKLQTGYIYHYAFAMMIGLAAVTTWYILGGAR